MNDHHTLVRPLSAPPPALEHTPEPAYRRQPPHLHRVRVPRPDLPGTDRLPGNRHPRRALDRLPPIPCHAPNRPPSSVHHLASRLHTPRLAPPHARRPRPALDTPDHPLKTSPAIPAPRQVPHHRRVNHPAQHQRAAQLTAQPAEVSAGARPPVGRAGRPPAGSSGGPPDGITPPLVPRPTSAPEPLPFRSSPRRRVRRRFACRYRTAPLALHPRHLRGRWFACRRPAGNAWRPGSGAGRPRRRSGPAAGVRSRSGVHYGEGTRAFRDRRGRRRPRRSRKALTCSGPSAETWLTRPQPPETEHLEGPAAQGVFAATLSHESGRGYEVCGRGRQHARGRQASVRRGSYAVFLRRPDMKERKSPTKALRP